MDKVEHDKKENRFYLPMEEGEAYVSYRMENDKTMDLHKTFTSPMHRGKGLAAKVVEAALDYALKHNLTVVPSCPYVKNYMEENNYQQKFQDRG